MRKKDIVEDNGKSVESELIERLSFNEHLRWAKWQRHVHASCEQNEDGSLTIPKEKVERWERQIVTDYENLPEPEKEADRRQVRQILNIIKNFYKNKRRGWKILIKLRNIFQKKETLLCFLLALLTIVDRFILPKFNLTTSQRF